MNAFNDADALIVIDMQNSFLRPEGKCGCTAVER